MPHIIFVSADGSRREAVAEAGRSVMNTAVDAGVDVILAECGGACSCGTCHCYIDEAWADRLPQIGDGEQAMLDCVIAPRRTSRLSCQVKVTDELDGLVVHLPAAQY